MPQNNDLLYFAKEAQKLGLLDQLTPQEKAKLMIAMPEAFAKEQEQAIQSINEQQNQAAQQENELSLAETAKDAITKLAVNPDAAIGNTVRGVARAFNPLPLVNLPGQLAGQGKLIEDDLETLESLVKFPIVRGAELSARLFIPKNERPNLTRFSEVLNEQRQLDRELRNLTPFVQEAAELGTAAYSLGTLSNVAKKAAAGNFAYNKGLAAVYEMRAQKEAKKATKLTNKILREGEGTTLDAVINRPEEVEKYLASNKEINVTDLANQLETELKLIDENLGARVGKFREAADSDTTTRLNVPENVYQQLKILEKRTLFEGESSLPSNMQKALRQSISAASRGITTPHDALKWINNIDDMINYGTKDELGSKTIREAQNVLLAVRRQIKDVLRQNNTAAYAEASEIEKGLRQPGTSINQIGQQRKELAYQLWADADDLYAGFKTEAEQALRVIKREGTVSWVDNLSNKNKPQVRKHLENSLNYMEALDPTAKGHGAAFFDRLNSLRAAQKIQGVQRQVNRVNQEKVHEIVRYWERAGVLAGGAAGLGYTNLIGGSGGYQGTSSLVGAGVGGYVGRKVGEKLADPARILEAAKNSKLLSKQARQLADDMLYLNNNLGAESNIAFLDLVGSIPAVNELIKFSSSINKSKGE